MVICVLAAFDSFGRFYFFFLSSHFRSRSHFCIAYFGFGLDRCATRVLVELQCVYAVVLLWSRVRPHLANDFIHMTYTRLTIIV